MKKRMVSAIIISIAILALSVGGMRASAPTRETKNTLFEYSSVTEAVISHAESTEASPETTTDIDSETKITESDTITETTQTAETLEAETIIINHYSGGGSVWGNTPDDTYLVTSVVETREPLQKNEPQSSVTTNETKTEETKYNDETTALHKKEEPAEETEPSNGEYSTVALMYHSINEEPFTSLTSLFVRPDDFEDHLATLNSLGYMYIFADEFCTSDRPTIMLTFDDGYEDNYTEMFPILKKYNAKATIFMVTSKIDTEGYLTSSQIKEMAESGLVRFASHTHDHLALTSLSEEALRYQFETSKNILTELTGYEMNAICYPGGSVTDFVVRIAGDYFDFGYTTVNSSYTLGCDPMLIPRVRVSRGVTGYGLASLIK